jgi:signal transduction histidine kinase
VTVRLVYRLDAVTIEVVNTAPEHPPVAGDPGHGLLGMRERATILGGSLSAGATPDGGFRVAAVLPCDPDTGGEPGTSSTDDRDRAGS